MSEPTPPTAPWISLAEMKKNLDALRAERDLVGRFAASLAKLMKEIDEKKKAPPAT